MNYLVHLSLAFPNSELMTGQFIADMISKKEIQLFPYPIQKGIKMHLWVDHSSNNNVPLSEINKFLHSVVHKYAPVASDIICDYLLYKNWKVYFNCGYSDFVVEVYSILSSQLEKFPEKAAETTRRMIKGDWLQQYKNYDGLEHVFVRMNKIAKFKVDFRDVLPVLKDHEFSMETYFNQFYSNIFSQRTEWLNLQSEMK